MTPTASFDGIVMIIGFDPFLQRSVVASGGSKDLPHARVSTTFVIEIAPSSLFKCDHPGALRNFASNSLNHDDRSNQPESESCEREVRREDRGAFHVPARGRRDIEEPNAPQDRQDPRQSTRGD